MENNLKKQFKYSTESNIILTYSNSNNKHGICGHFFEVIDYWDILRSYFTVDILISEDLTKEEMDIALSKYKPEFISEVSKHIKFVRPRTYNTPNSILILTDGNLDTKLIYNVKNIILFPCGKRDYSYLLNFKQQDKIIIMHDNRLQYIIPSVIKEIHYIKKINFDILKNYPVQATDNLIYATSNCRLLSNEILKKYLDLSKKENKDLYVAINKESPLLLNPIIDDHIIYKVLPIPDFFFTFLTFIYTGIERRWDCSNRILAECKYHGINRIIDDEINDDYLSIDLGLKYRLQDIKNNFKSLYLKENDPIIEICNILLNDGSIQEYINKKYIIDFDEIDKALRGK